MDLPDLKQLRKLADACRKAGIRTFKGFGFEFTLEDSYQPARRTKAPAKVNHPDTTFESDTLTDEELMLWSVQRPPNEETTE